LKKSERFNYGFLLIKRMTKRECFLNCFVYKKIKNIYYFDVFLIKKYFLKKFYTTKYTLKYIQKKK
jgi:hypothetical protein